jgi:hypothetical protein
MKTELESMLQENGKQGLIINMKNRQKVNPFAYWVSDIIVTRFAILATPRE